MFGNSDWEGSSWDGSGTYEVSGTKRVSSVSESWGSDGSWGSGVSTDGSWGSSDGWGSSDSWSGDSVGDGSDGNSWGSDGVGYLMGLGVGAGLVDWLFVGDFSGYWSNNWFSSEDWLLGKNWAGAEGLGDDWSWLDGSDGSWLVNMGVFSNWDGLVSNLWGNFSESFSGLYGVGEVSSQSVVGDGSRIVSWGTDKGLSSYEWSTYKWSWSNNSGVGGGNEASKDSDKSLKL